jgi:hypothetical protein
MLAPRAVTMRWNAFVASLSPDAGNRVVNLLTVGWGYARLAGRAAGANAPAPVVLGHARQAVTMLVAAQALLGQDDDAPPAPDRTSRASPSGDPQADRSAGERGKPPATIAAGAWRDLLARCDEADADRLHGSLADGVVSARRAAETMLLDGEVAWVRRHVEQAAAQLTIVLEQAGGLLAR